jgi:hypothetical protein
MEERSGAQFCRQVGNDDNIASLRFDHYRFFASMSEFHVRGRPSFQVAFTSTWSSRLLGENRGIHCGSVAR